MKTKTVPAVTTIALAVLLAFPLSAYAADNGFISKAAVKLPRADVTVTLTDTFRGYAETDSGYKFLISPDGSISFDRAVELKHSVGETETLPAGQTRQIISGIITATLGGVSFSFSAPSLDEPISFSELSNAYSNDIMSLSPDYYIPQAAVPAKHKVVIDGKEIAFDAYNINGSNYFKLRDIAYAINGTDSQFSVAWDNTTGNVTIKSDDAYVPTGGELALFDSREKSASRTTHNIYLDGGNAFLEGYNIGGNNYFKLRDIGSAAGFGVEWDAETSTVTISTSSEELVVE